MTESVGSGATKRSLDDVDQALLEILRTDGRITNRALAQRLGMTAPAVLRRRKRLEREGVIRGYTVEVAGAAAGLVVYVGITVSEVTSAPASAGWSL